MTLTELELIAIRDREAMARPHDRDVAIVGAFCARTGASSPRRSG
ncbi:MAG: hypothetical protein ACTHQQ_19435 [Solirubrobacteraceae bacterium]